jgi:hypothetical protein
MLLPMNIQRFYFCRVIVSGLLGLIYLTSQGSGNQGRGDILYQNNLSEASDVSDWIMEGQGITEFKDGWMEMYSPDEAAHHVFWCPEDLPEKFIAEWEAQNLNPDAGLCIIFFAAKGTNGEGIFNSSLPVRDGVFSGYTKGQINSYHISYYTNAPIKPDRGKAHLRKNNGFNLVQEGKNGIPADSTSIHQLKLIKNGQHILFFVDGRKVIDWCDTKENEPRPPYREGKIGFRQMQWTHFRYRNLRVWELSDSEDLLESMKSVQAIHPKERIWPEPSNDMVASRNPPTLMWPADGKQPGDYSVRLSRDPDFGRDSTIEVKNIPWAIYNPFVRLAPGSWYWQWKGKGKNWSDTQRFVIGSESLPWEPPSAEEFITAIPSYHPRVLVDRPGIHAFQEKNSDRREALSIINAANHALERPVPSEKNDVLKIKGDDPAKTDKLRKDASKIIGQTLYSGVGPLCQAFILTGDSRYAKRAIQWALEAAQWDPNGVTRINDFGDSRIMLSMALVYDSLHDYLTEKEAGLLLEATAARANNFYHDYVNKKENVVLSNHVWQHIFHYFFDTALALQGDHPDADLWISYLYNMFLARAPILGGADGGWVHGMSYFRMNMEVLIDVPMRINAYTGFYFISHAPWYWENPYYFIYGFPPGSTASGFSDNSHDLPEPRGDYLAYADALSRLLQNPYAAWYRDRVTEVAGNMSPYYPEYYRENFPTDLSTAVRLENSTMLQWYRMKYLYDIEPMQPKSPADLPKARVFNDVGLVTMHSRDLSQPAEGNLFLAMRASPFGTYSHMLSDNNTFNMVYGGDRLFYHTGYKVSMSAPHRQEYYKHTRSHNGILIDGKGQPYHTEAYAWIENFLTGDHLSYAVGNASNAYDSRTEGFDAGLKTFRRHILMLRPDIVVVYDELEADDPAEWSFLLHSYNQIELNGKNRSLSTRNRAGKAIVNLFSSAEMEWSVTNEYPVPAENWRGITDGSGSTVDYTNNAWHFSANTGKKQRMRFLAIFQVRPNEGVRDFDFDDIRIIDDNSYRLGEWKVIAQMNQDLPARIQVVNTLDGVVFTSMGELPNGVPVDGIRQFSAKLVERQEEKWIFSESVPGIPEAAMTAIRTRKDQ